MVNTRMLSAVMLMVGGIMLGIPPVYDFLAFGGYPVLNLIVGWVMIVVSLMVFFGRA